MTPALAAGMTSYELTREEREHIWDLSERLVRAPSWEAPATPASPGFPSPLGDALRRLAGRTSPDGCLLLRGLHVGELPPTPVTHGSQVLREHATSGTLALFADALGSLVGYEDEKDGALFHEVHPVRGEEEHIENSGSVAFDFHTENVHHPLRPDFLGLLCLRQDHEGTAATRVAPVSRAVALLDEAQRQTLSASGFTSLYPTSFTRGRSGLHPRSAPHQVLRGSTSASLLRFNSHTTSGTGPAAASALRALAEALEEVCVDLVLEPGDLVLVDNHVAAHGRSAFTPRYDGGDRWLRRCYSLRQIPPAVRRQMTHRRVLPALPPLSF